MGTNGVEQHASLKHAGKQIVVPGSLIRKLETHAFGKHKGFRQPKYKRNRISLYNHCSPLFSIIVVEEHFANECR